MRNQKGQRGLSESATLESDNALRAAQADHTRAGISLVEAQTKKTTADIKVAESQAYKNTKDAERPDKPAVAPVPNGGGAADR